MNADSLAVDVVILGGGSAGISASLAAARLGAKVLMLEKSDQLGGMASLANVNTICGLYRQDVNHPAEFANAGIAREFALEMMRVSGQSSPTKMGKVYVLPHNPIDFDRVAQDFISKESGIQCSLLSTCTAIRKSSDGYVVTYQSGDTSISTRCRSIVDCSADALVAKFLGGTRVQESEGKLQRPAYIFSLDGVGMEASSEQFKLQLALDLVHAVRDDKLPSSVMGATCRMIPNTEKCFISIDLEANGDQWNPTQDDSIDNVYQAGQQLALTLTTFLKDHYPAFEHTGEPQFPQQLGIRESYRWLGKYQLTKEDLVRGKSFEDTVVYASWPIELRETHRGARFSFFENAVASIPLRCLASAEFEGIYIAGRCISATHEALASVRVMGTCLAMGDAAGQAAALFSRGLSDIYEQSEQIRRSIMI